MPNRDEVDGRFENIKGRIKEAAGTLTGNENLEKEGSDQRAGGSVQEGLGRARRKLGEAIEDFGEDLKK
jgi:uncharacterized protein YjbJ (UPF0337 family)